MNNFKLTDNFNFREFQCRHCGQVKIDSKLVERLQALRQRLGAPVVITSAFRCVEHNRNVGGAPNSYHVQGLAVDIAVAPTGLSVEALTKVCQEFGFSVGAYPDNGFVHVDLRPGKPIRFK